MKFKVKRNNKQRNDYWLIKWREKKINERKQRQKKLFEFVKNTISKKIWDKVGEKIIKRFLSKIDVRSINANECWNWSGRRTIDGYGQFDVRSKEPELSHRFMWIIIHGEIQDGVFILHKCDNPTCVNYEHLFSGTQQDNVVDMVNKGRTAKGEFSGRATLTREEVAEIREMWKTGKYSRRELAKKVQKPEGTVNHIVRNKTWYDAEYQKWLNDDQIRFRLGMIGEKCYSSKHTNEEIYEIRELWKTGKYNQRELAVIIGIPRATLDKIVKNKSYYSVDYQKWLNSH